ncbi:RDD family protein [Fibrisoma montanum]|uniref:RDD family protein n=1 Tax=Fibrisoma montanum TaxID=2305895 RepID=A0A418MJ99_9BACT|nr:RDD family protein [Fibrisoma montanum]RIV27466.1 RDD family protein [Fibrisoma montanum]
MSVAIQTSQNVLLEYEPASVGDRILATLLDYVVFLGWLTVTLGIPAALSIRPGNFYVGLIVILPIFIYDLVCEWLLNGRSVGKIALGIRVVMLDGSQPGLGAYLLRWLLRIVDTRLFGGLVAVIAIAANGKGQRVGDIAAGTTVVKLKPAVSLSDVVYQPLRTDYYVQFPDVRLLSDRDIAIVREALRRGDATVQDRTAEKIKEVTGIRSDLHSRAFLETIVSDYQFLTTQ